MNLSFARLVGALVASLAVFALPALAQEAVPPSTAPVIVKPIFGQPKIEVIKVEDEPKRHYEKWRVTQIVVLANLPPSMPKATYLLPGYARPIFTLHLQTDEKKADLRNRFVQLKDELNAATLADLDVRQETPAYKAIIAHLGQVEGAGAEFKLWRYRQLTSFGEENWPGHTLLPTQCAGALCFVERSRTYEIEGVKSGRRTLFKAQVETFGDNMHYTTLCLGRVLNIETGEIEKAK